MTSEIVSGELAGLAGQIKAEHQACLEINFQSIHRSIEHALKVGELLYQAKVLVKHGDWTKWIEQHCEFTPRMARNYIKLWRNQDYLKTETVSEMTLFIETLRRCLMAIKENEKSTWGLPAGKPASEIMLDGYLRLGAAVVVQAVKDYQSDDILRAIDALAWWLIDGAFWMETLELGVDDPDEVFSRIARGDYADNRRFSRAFEQRGHEDDNRTSEGIQAGVNKDPSGTGP